MEDRELLLIKLALASLARGNAPTIHSLDWSQGPGVSSNCKMDERPSSQVGTVFHTFSVLYHLQAWFTGCQARRTVSAVFFLRGRSEGVLNLPHVIGAVTWGIKSTVCEAQYNKPDPRTRPPEWLYVSTLVQSWVLQWDHTARFTWHPGINQTISFLERLVAYTWHTREHILACSTWAQNKPQTFPFAGLLRPLPTSRRPWSQIALDFMTGLLLLQEIW